MPGRYLPRVWQNDPGLDAPARYRRACSYEAFMPFTLDQLSMTLEVSAAGVVSEAEHAIRTLNEVARPALAPLARLLLRTESVASSRIEGAQLGLRELARAEAKIEAGGTAGPTALEILANVDAMELAVNDAAQADHFAVRDIIAIHRRLMARALDTDRVAGRIRTSQTWIGGNDYNPCGADFIPPPPEDVPALLDDLCTAVMSDVLPPLVQAALVHAQFETIHPFADGNGQTGRALIHVVLRRRKLAPAYVPPISVVLAAHRARYIDGLTRFRGDAAAQWVEQFATAARGAAILASAYLEQMQRLSRSWRSKLAATPGMPRADAAAWRVIEILPAHPMITAPVAAAATGRSKPQIYQALAQLETAGVLTPVSSSRRNRTWEAAGLLDLLAGLDQGEWPEAGK